MPPRGEEPNPEENAERTPRPRSFKLPQRTHLKRRGEYDAVFKQGGKAVSAALVIYALPNGMNYNRLGLAVGKKLGNAVRRNRIRRMIREAFRLENPTLPQGFSFVCIPRAAGFPGKTTELMPLFRETFLRAARPFLKEKERR